MWISGLENNSQLLRWETVAAAWLTCCWQCGALQQNERARGGRGWVPLHFVGFNKKHFERGGGKKTAPMTFSLQIKLFFPFHWLIDLIISAKRVECWANTQEP